MESGVRFGESVQVFVHLAQSLRVDDVYPAATVHEYSGHVEAANLSVKH